MVHNASSEITAGDGVVTFGDVGIDGDDNDVDRLHPELKWTA